MALGKLRLDAHGFAEVAQGFSFIFRSHERTAEAIVGRPAARIHIKDMGEKSHVVAPVAHLKRADESEKPQHQYKDRTHSARVPTIENRSRSQCRSDE